MGSQSRHLLIVACSQRKRQDPGGLPAIERYDGVSFRVLRKAQREGYWPENLDVLILSAKYGLIDAFTPIANYEQRMTCERANQLKTQVRRVLEEYVERSTYREVYVDLGQDYTPALQDLEQLLTISSVTYAKGRIGERLSHLKKWIVSKACATD
jgi:cytoplasmic iron level regulating protein YaaA (DUF328/UPF0246 family)